MSRSIDQVDDETRRTAEAAARQAGITVEEWLRRAVALSAGTTTPPRPRQNTETDDLVAVAAAVARLARRVRAMSADERAAVAGLSGRLDQIERHLGRLHEQERRGERSPAALRDLGTMVGRLARDIEDADERARTMVEGLGGTRLRRPDDRAAGIRSPGPAASRPAPAAASGQDFDELRRRLDALLAHAPTAAAARPEARATDLGETLRMLEERIEDAKARLAPSPAATAAEDARIHELESRLAGIAAQLAVPPEPPLGVGADIAEQIAEIAARQRSDTFGAELAAMRDENRGLAAEIGALRREVSDLVGRVLAVGLGAAEDQESHFALIRRIEALSAANPVDRHALADIRAELGRVRDTVEAGARETTLLDRFDDLFRRVPDRSRLDALGGEIADLRRLLEADDSPKAVARLEMRMSELARSIETTFNARQAAAEASAVGTAAALADIRGAIEDLAAGRGPAVEAGQAAELAAGLAELRRAVETRQSFAGDGEALRRLESRLDRIAAQMDDVIDRGAPVGEMMSGVYDRLEALAERIEGVGRTAAEPAGLDAIRDEIAAIRSEIGLREPPRLDYLEAQIREVADRLETATRPDADSGQLAELEARIADLAGTLDRAGPRTAALERIEADLVNLQAILADSRQDSIAAARAAAREAVRDLADNGRDGDIVRTLRQDLDRVRHAADDTGHRTEETLKGLQMTLAGIVERLGRIEGESPQSPTEAAPAEPPVPPLTRAAEEAIRRARPMEPGAPRADLAALRELAASSGETERRATDRRADFIAAARRAAHAAVAEAGQPEPAEPEPRQQDGTFARIGQAIRNRRKPFLLAAAAIVIAIGALHLYGSRTGESAGIARSAAPAPAIAAVAGAKAIPPGPLVPASTAAVASATSAVPVADQAALVAPPADARTAMALAAGDAVGGRFGDAFSGASAEAVTASAEDTTASTGPAAPEVAVPGPADDPALAPIGSDKLRAAAVANDPAAFFEIGTRYAEGRGVAQSLAAAAEWYERAAEGGLAVAQYRLGSLYERGQGVTKDLDRAVTWYQRAADQGNVGAMHNLAVMMSEGVDGTPDHQKALEWFLAAGSYGVKDSQYNLGVIYARGLGPEQDLVESYKWFAVAAAQGDKDAATRRDEVAGLLDPDQLARARAIVQAWRAKPPLPEANSVKVPQGGWDGVTDAIGEADRVALVKKIQTLLTENGYDPGPADGIEGPKTKEAVRAFQRSIGSAETGEIDRTLALALADRPT